MATALVIEDERPLLGYIRRLLERAGHTVIGAESGEQAMDLARDSAVPINLVVADVILRGSKGPEIAERLLRLHPDMACLFMSGFPLEELQHRHLLENRTLGSARVGFLPKPFSPSQLLEAVKALL
jgi:two-component system cell cycle sensor histidine kinase/response regulator CckA